jgi:hypothetical protein
MTVHVRHRFGPVAIQLAKQMHADGVVPHDTTLAALEQIAREHPTLSFHDFWGAAVLAQALAIKPKGRA